MTNNLVFTAKYEKVTAKKGAKTFDVIKLLITQYHSE